MPGMPGMPGGMPGGMMGGMGGDGGLPDMMRMMGGMGGLAALLGGGGGGGGGGGSGGSGGWGDDGPSAFGGLSPPVVDALRGLPRAVSAATRDAAASAIQAVMAGGVGIPALVAAATEVVIPTVRSFAAQSVGDAARPVGPGDAGPSSAAAPGGAAPSADAVAALAASLGAQLGPLLGGPAASAVADAATVAAHDPAVVTVLGLVREEDMAREGGPGGAAGSRAPPPAAAASAVAAEAGPLVVPPALLQPGSTGDGVARLQRALVAVGALPAADVAADGGAYGPTTTAAVARLQREMGLEVLVGGVYDDMTAASLSSLVDARVPVAMASGAAGAAGAGAGGGVGESARTAEGGEGEAME